jgi:hypothetical protein
MIGNWDSSKTKHCISGTCTPSILVKAVNKLKQRVTKEREPEDQLDCCVSCTSIEIQMKLNLYKIPPNCHSKRSYPFFECVQ